MAAGIYRIHHKINGRSYIGQSIDLEVRWQYHIIRLRVRTHKSKLLQRDFNAWFNQCIVEPTEFPFEFEVLMYCSKEQLEKFEEIFIAALQPEYNTQKYKTLRKTLDKTMLNNIVTKFKIKRTRSNVQRPEQRRTDANT